jgi:membrane protease YdiL (CAAX protease family)
LDDIAIPATNEFDDVVLTPVAPLLTPPRVWTVFVAVVAALVAAVAFQTVIAIVLATVEVLRGTDHRQIANELMGKMATPWMFILLASGAQLAMLGTAIVAAWYSPVPMKRRLGLLPPEPTWEIIPAVMLGSWASLGVGMMLAVWLAEYVPPDPMVEELYKNITIDQAVPFVLFIALVPGITEELLFRGYVQRRLLERWHPAMAITVTSLMFALIHIQPHHVVAAFPMGLWLGVVAWKTGSVIPSMCCHAFINGSLNAWRMVVKFGGMNEATDLDVQLAGALVGAIFFFVCVIEFWRMGAPADTNDAAAVG